MQTERPTPHASIVIPMSSGGVWRDSLLAIPCLQVDYPFELIVVDSTDGTPEQAERSFANRRTNPQHVPLQLVRITLHELMHRRTRNLCVQLAQSQFVVFLSQDATPVGSAWN